ncbi:hypothetical protein SynPROSU1_01537 [Synechococcus sp. PROS-U-1]|nr:hypothetical protein SynPROSU1_01537 [Synechococcus sp. PROS-U-1]
MAESLRWCITVGHTIFTGSSALNQVVDLLKQNHLWIDLSSLKQAQKLISLVPQMNVFIAFTTGNRERMVPSMGQRNHQPTSHCLGVSNGVDRLDLLNRYRCQSLVKPSTCGCRTRADRDHFSHRSI